MFDPDISLLVFSMWITISSYLHSCHVYIATRSFHVFTYLDSSHVSIEFQLYI